MVHYTNRTIHLTDIVFPKNINHHDTLFGGAALSYMDKVAFIAATRFGRRHFVTASCDNIDFHKPAFKGNIVDFAATVVDAGKRSLKVEVVMMAEDMLSGKQVICTRGTFNMVAVPGKDVHDMSDVSLSELKMSEKSHTDPQADMRIVELVFADDTNHHGSLFGGHGLSLMAKAGFIAATRKCREVMVLASLERTNFKEPIQIGEIVDLSAKVVRIGNKSLTVNVKMWGEGLLTGERKFCADSDFIMVAVDKDGNSTKINK
ncbi:MAG: hotdog domain-containing protein [Emcibacteraceae bacterium]|nr:hotdog domain-containing protein [Emcibacteraceae bacterium]